MKQSIRISMLVSALMLNISNPLLGKSLDLVMEFESGGEVKYMEHGNQSPVFSYFIDGIQQEVPIVASSVLLYLLTLGVDIKINWLEERGDENNPYIKDTWLPYQQKIKNALANLKDESKWQVYANQAGDFAFLLPKSYYPNETASSLGFNAQIQKIAGSQIASTFNQKKSAPININNLKSMFDPKSDVRKRIFLNGHGTTKTEYSKEAYVAQMDHQQYIAFLNFFNPTTDFLFVFSCYAAGSNLMRMYKDQLDTNKEIFTQASLSFPIALGAITDAPVGTKLQTPNFKAFFKALDTYLANPRKGSLKSALNEIYKLAEISAIPTIRFPGSESFFRAVEVDDKVKMLTMVGLKAYELEYKLKGAQVPPLELNNLDAILIYPAIINIPLKIVPVVKKNEWGSEEIKTTIIPMISGNSYQIIDSINAADSNLQDIASIFDWPGKLSKAIFVKKIICKDGVYENVTVQHKGYSINYVIKIISSMPGKPGSLSFAEYKDSYVQIDYSAAGWAEHIKHTNLKKLNNEEGLKLIKQLLIEAKPSEEAIRQATGGQQTLNMLESTLNEYLK